MGLLDDAIRQHLELKRQHGASEDELQRQEEEALGPARRDVAPAEPSDEDRELELEEAEASAPDADEHETELYEEDEPLEPETELAGAGERFGRGARRAHLSQTRNRSPRRPGGRAGTGGHAAVPAPFDAASAFEELGEEDEPEDEAAPDEDRRRAGMPTCSRTRPTSSRRRRNTTGSGSSRSRRATSTSTRSLAPRVSCGGDRPPRRPPQMQLSGVLAADTTEPSMPS